MNRQRAPFAIGGLYVTVCAALLLVSLSATLARQNRGKPDPSEIPKSVIDALKAEFPAAKVHKWSREEEDHVVLYDIEFTQSGRKFEADIREDGTIDNWEKEIAVGDLPGPVKTAVEEGYPGAVLGEIMEITEVKDGKQALEGYEIVLETADGDKIEVTIAPDGRTVEESGQGD